MSPATIEPLPTTMTLNPRTGSQGVETSSQLTNQQTTSQSQPLIEVDQVQVRLEKSKDPSFDVEVHDEKVSETECELDGRTELFLGEVMGGRIEERSSERTEERSSERTEERSSERTEERTSERTEERTSERTEERTSERTEERTSERTEETICEPFDTCEETRSDASSLDLSHLIDITSGHPLIFIVILLLLMLIHDVTSYQDYIQFFPFKSSSNCDDFILD